MHGCLHLWCSCFRIFKAQLCWVGTLLLSKESWPFWLHCRYRGQNFLERFCVLSFIFNLRIRKKHKDHIIRKYYYLFSFGDLLAIYFFIIHRFYQNFPSKKINGILKLESSSPSSCVLENRIGFGFSSSGFILSSLLRNVFGYWFTNKQTNKFRGALEIYCE